MNRRRSILGNDGQIYFHNYGFMSLKIITLNIWKGRLLPSLVTFFQNERADILFLQEIFNGHEARTDRYQAFSTLRRELGYPYSSFAAECLYNLDVGRIPHGNAIFSKFPIVGEKIVFFDEPYREDYVDAPENYEHHPRNVQQVVVQEHGITFHLFNTHGIWELSGKDNERHLSMSRTIVGEIADKERVILAGDFNLPPNTQTIRHIEDHLTSVFGDTLTTTFNMKRKDNPDYGKVVVDMIFISPDLTVIERDCPQVDVSDHYPLICTVDL